MRGDLLCEFERCCTGELDADEDGEDGDDEDDDDDGDTFDVDAVLSATSVTLVTVVKCSNALTVLLSSIKPESECKNGFYYE